MSSAEVAVPVVLLASTDAVTGWIVIRHEGGPTLDIGEIDVRISVDGTPLKLQPPVPFPEAEGL